MATLLTCSTTLYAYNPMTISDYLYHYYNVSSDAPTPRSLAQTSRLPFLPLHCIFNSIFCSRTLHHTMQFQERLPNTNPNRPADLDLFGPEAFCKSHSSPHDLLCNSEVGSRLLNYAEASSLSRRKLMKIFLAISLSFFWRQLPFPSL